MAAEIGELRARTGTAEGACERESYSELELAGLVRMFEFTFELAWKTMRDLLVYEGYEVNSPRAGIRLGLAAGLIDDAEMWPAALESLNRLTHTYDAATAKEAERAIKGAYAPLLEKLAEVLRRKRDGAS